MQAAILSAKLPHVLQWTEMRQKNAGYYDQVLANIDEITLPKVRPHSTHTYHLYVVRVQRRDELAEYLKSKEIETAIHYPTPLPFLEAYKYLGHVNNDFPVSEAYQHQILSLPMYPELTTEMMNYVSSTIKEFYA